MSILQMSVYGAVMIAVICFIRMLLLNRLPKKTFIILWAIVIFRLLVPFTLPSQFSIYSAVDKIEYSANEYFAEEKIERQSPPNNVVPSEKNNIVIPDDNNIVIPNQDKEPINIYVTIWIVGALGLTLYFMIAYFKCRREFNMSLPIEHEYINDWKNEHKLSRKYDIRQSSKINTPLTYGILKPIILLPKKMYWSDTDNMSYVLMHEYVHIKHFDSFLKFILTVTLCVHWFNPLVWVMYILANNDIELCCDQTVVHLLGGKAKYANILINMAQQQTLLTPLCNNFSKNSVEERVRSIMKMKKSPIIMVVSAVLLVTGIITLFATSAKPSDRVETENLSDHTVPTTHMNYENDNIPTNEPKGTEIEGEISITSDRIDKINIDFIAGDIKIVNCDDEQISIYYSDNNRNVKCYYYIMENDLTIKMHSDGNMFSTFKGTLVANIPKSMSPDIFVEAMSSDIAIDAILEDVVIDSMSGDVFLNNNITDIVVNSMSGDINIISDQHKTQSIIAESMSGDFILVGEDLNYTLDIVSLEEESIKKDKNDSNNQEMSITFDSIRGKFIEKTKLELSETSYNEPKGFKLEQQTMIEDKIEIINVDFISGDIFIANTDNDKISFDYSGNNSDAECYYYIEGDEIFIETYYKEKTRMNQQEDNLYINIPNSMSPKINIDIISGDVTADAMLEEITINSVSGDMLLYNNITEIRADNVSGDIIIISDQHKTRTVHADSVSGSFIMDGDDFNYNLNFDSLSEKYSISESNHSEHQIMNIDFDCVYGNVTMKP